MDGPRAHSASSPPLLQSSAVSTQLASLSSPQTDPSSINCTSHSSPSRQQRLLQSRNARFPAKQLSISGLSNKLTQLVNNEDQLAGIAISSKHQENRLQKSKSTGTIAKRVGLGILEEISNTTRARSFKRPTDIPIYLDGHEELSLQVHLPRVFSPSVEAPGRPTSPIGSNCLPEVSNTMQLRERSLNEGWSSLIALSPSLKAKRKTRTSQAHFDAEEYIQHIEKELQQVRDEAYSPLTRRPMKEKLRAANKENERLQKELALLREKFETEVKRTVEHKTMTEVELKRRVRDLEDFLEEKEATIHELQCFREEKRLESNVIETLKATIDRLEQDKSDLEEINLGMSKRNDVLTQLLAMSPTRTPNEFMIGSPTREKRSTRPISLIIPQHQSSSKLLGQSSSIARSPGPLNSAEISPFKLSPESNNIDTIVNRDSTLENDVQRLDLDQADRALWSPFLQEKMSRRWTVISETSNSSASHAQEQRAFTRKKARKFVAGSTQLKPLLLPTLTGDITPSASTDSSPLSDWPADDVAGMDPDRTILAEDPERPSSDGAATSAQHSDILACLSPTNAADGPGPAVIQNEIESQGYLGGERDAISPVHSCFLLHRLDSTTVSTCGSLGESERSAKFTDWNGTIIPRKHRPRIGSCSMQAMPMPSTPDSLATMPPPLFTPSHRGKIVHSMGRQAGLESVSPAAFPHVQLSHRKRRNLSSHESNLGSPISKFRHCQMNHPSESHKMLSFHSPTFDTYESVERSDCKLMHQLRKVQSSDNFVEVLRRRDFAARPLAALTIRTIYKIVANCTKIVRDIRRDPFTLARKVLANAWRMHWAVLGKLSWWVLGLFIYPQNSRKTRPPIDWDQYDGESIASRYCSQFSDIKEGRNISLSSSIDDELRLDVATTQADILTIASGNKNLSQTTEHRTSWMRSLVLWGKFSTALILAVRGAIVKGPGEMLRDTVSEPKIASLRHEPSLDHDTKKSRVSKPRMHPLYQNSNEAFSGSFHSYQAKQDRMIVTRDLSADFEFRSDTQLDSSSLLDQIQQPEYDATPYAQPSRE